MEYYSREIAEKEGKAIFGNGPTLPLATKKKNICYIGFIRFQKKCFKRAYRIEYTNRRILRESRKKSLPNEFSSDLDCWTIENMFDIVVSV